MEDPDKFKPADSISIPLYARQPRRATSKMERTNLRRAAAWAATAIRAKGGAGARLAQNPITFQAFLSYVRKPKGAMPPFGNQIPEAELADIYAFLKSAPPSPDPKSIPLLNQIG